MLRFRASIRSLGGALGRGDGIRAAGARCAAVGMVAFALLAADPVAASSAPAGEAAVLRASGGSAPHPGEHLRSGAARPGDFCLPGGCRPRPASLSNGAAFGAALIAIAWQARRRPSATA